MSSEHTDAAGDGDDGPEPSSAPEPEVAAVWKAHADAITNAEMPADRPEAAEPVFREMAKADVAGESVEMWIEQLRAIDDTVTKPTLREEYERARDDVRATLPRDAIEEPTPLDTWLEEQVARVVVCSSPDTHSDADYHWKLTDGREFATDGDTLFRWQRLRKVIFDSLGAWPGQPQHADNAAWPDWVAGFITDNREEREKLGPRSEAIEHLADTIRSATAYATPDAALRPARRSGWMARTRTRSGSIGTLSSASRRSTASHRGPSKSNSILGGSSPRTPAP